MTENPKLVDDNMGSNGKTCEYEEKDVQKISVFNQINGIQYGSIKSDSFIVDMERLSPLPEKEISANSRITLQRTLSRKVSTRGGEKRSNLSAGSEREIIATSPRAALQGFCTPEKAAVVTMGATPADHQISSQVHNQITITTGNGTTTTENKSVGKRLSFRRSSASWTIDPRRILFFFATISSIGTILLIYFTLSVGKLNTDDNALN